ncbi:MAG: sensor histidine kinase [Desulfobaccales bacterium]
MMLRTKILLAQAPMALALILLGVIAVTTIDRLGSASEKILKDNFRSVLATQRMKEAIERMDSAALFIILGRMEEGQQMALPNRKLFETELEVQQHNITEPGEQRATDVLVSAWQDYAALYARFRSEASGPALQNFYFSRLYPKFKEVKAEAEVILSMNQDAMVRKSDAVRHFSRHLDTLITMAAILAALAGIVASMVLTGKIVRPLSILTQTARRIKEGDLEVRARVAGSDEIAVLAQEFNTMTDSLERYRASSLGELLLIQQTSQAAMDSLPDPVVSLDLEGKVLGMNRAAEALFGASIPGTFAEYLRYLDQDLTAGIEKARRHVTSGKGPYIPEVIGEAVRTTLGGAERYFLPQAAPLFDDLGNLASITLILRDVTLLSKLDDMSRNLMGTLAHEFRTPLTSLHMAIHILLEQLGGSLSEKHLDLLYAAREDCERMQNLVDDTLNIVRIQAGKIELLRVNVRIMPLVENVISQHRLLAEERGLTLTRKLSPLGDEVFADPDHLELVFANLIINAVRHTSAGGAIEIRTLPVDGFVRFEVADTGEGIPEEYQAQIFDKYYRVPGSIREGTGLGLNIAKNIIEAHGGQIGVDSKPGQGSTFWFTLPIPGDHLINGKLSEDGQPESA